MNFTNVTMSDGAMLQISEDKQKKFVVSSVQWLVWRCRPMVEYSLLNILMVLFPRRLSVHIWVLLVIIKKPQYCRGSGMGSIHPLRVLGNGI